MDSTIAGGGESRGNGGSNVRRRDTTKGPPLRILSLDGGGVRGYSMLIIIQELMHCIYVETEGRAPRTHQIPKPADHFDLIVGTGTGGLIALMLGRLRLDLETCKELYVRLTRYVFETDKTIAGIPYRSTLYKASKLEQAIMDAVAEHTVDEREGNDSTVNFDYRVTNPLSPTSGRMPRRNPSNASVVSFSARSPRSQMARPIAIHRYGDPHTRLYDEREHRTKTAVTAIYRGTPRGGPPALLRSYDSRREPASEFDCTIWEAGRATCAIGLAFKPIQIGQTVFHDDGAGTFNPAPEALDEAVVNEWPGREVGVFVSIGTGKRPKGSDSNQQAWYDDFMTGLAEARKRLISKIEGCERIHEYMIREHLARRNVNVETYYRFNVEVGVGEFGMNEWHRLSDISSGTRRYLARDHERKMVQNAATKIARISQAVRRLLQQQLRVQQANPEGIRTNVSLPLTAVELPAEVPLPTAHAQRMSSAFMPRMSYDSGVDQISPSDTSPVMQPVNSRPSTAPGSNGSSGASKPLPPEPDRIIVTAPTPAEHQTSPIKTSTPPRQASISTSGHPQTTSQPIPIAPPLPPKTPISSASVGRNTGSGIPPRVLPYPIEEEPPPVNMALKPTYRRR